MRLPRLQLRLRSLLLAIAVTAVCYSVAGWVTGGWAHGVEWSPDTFCHRSFRYFIMFGNVIPLDGAPMTSYQTQEWESDLESWLKREGYVVEQTDQPRWFLSKGFAPAVRGWHGPAKHWRQEMGCWGHSSDEWIKWSSDRRSAAAHLWPAVVRLAREESGRGMYVASSLLRAARESKTDDEYFAEATRLLDLHNRGLDP